MSHTTTSLLGSLIMIGIGAAILFFIFKTDSADGFIKEMRDVHPIQVDMLQDISNRLERVERIVEAL